MNPRGFAAQEFVGDRMDAHLREADSQNLTKGARPGTVAPSPRRPRPGVSLRLCDVLCSACGTPLTLCRPPADTVLTLSWQCADSALTTPVLCAGKGR